jgi:hypothetical protein
MAAMAGAMLVVNLFVIPAFAKVYKGFGAELPWMTKLLIGVSNFTVAWWPWLIGGGIAAVVGFREYVRTARTDDSGGTASAAAAHRRQDHLEGDDRALRPAASRSRSAAACRSRRR